MKLKRLKQLVALLLTMSLIAGSSVIVQAASASATTIKLSKIEGSTVTVTSGSGRALTTRNNMTLYNGYSVITGEDSYAYLMLDNTKAIKLDENTNVNIVTQGKKNDINLVSGSLFFDVSEKLKSNESLNIKTSNTTMGIRGTSGNVRTINSDIKKLFDDAEVITGDAVKISLQQSSDTKIALYEGSADVEILNEFFQQEGSSNTVPITAGQILKTSGLTATVTPLSKSDIPSFVSSEIISNPELKVRIEESLENIVGEIDWIAVNQEAKTRETSAKEEARTIIIDTYKRTGEIIFKPNETLTITSNEPGNTESVKPYLTTVGIEPEEFQNNEGYYFTDSALNEALNNYRDVYLQTPRGQYLSEMGYQIIPSDASTAETPQIYIPKGKSLTIPFYFADTWFDNIHTITVDGELIINGRTRFNNTSIINGSGKITVNNSCTFECPDLSMSCAFNVINGWMLNWNEITSSNEINLNNTSTFENHGVIKSSSKINLNETSTIRNLGTIDISSTGAINITSESKLINNFGCKLINSGTISTDETSFISNLSGQINLPGGHIINSGTINGKVENGVDDEPDCPVRSLAYFMNSGTGTITALKIGKNGFVKNTNEANSWVTTLTSNNGYLNDISDIEYAGEISFQTHTPYVITFEYMDGTVGYALVDSSDDKFTIADIIAPEPYSDDFTVWDKDIFRILSDGKELLDLKNDRMIIEEAEDPDATLICRYSTEVGGHTYQCKYLYGCSFEEALLVSTEYINDGCVKLDRAKAYLAVPLLNYNEMKLNKDLTLKDIKAPEGWCFYFATDIKYERPLYDDTTTNTSPDTFLYNLAGHTIDFSECNHIITSILIAGETSGSKPLHFTSTYTKNDPLSGILDETVFDTENKGTINTGERSSLEFDDASFNNIKLELSEDIRVGLLSMENCELISQGGSLILDRSISASKNSKISKSVIKNAVSGSAITISNSLLHVNNSELDVTAGSAFKASDDAVLTFNMNDGNGVSTFKVSNASAVVITGYRAVVKLSNDINMEVTDGNIVHFTGDGCSASNTYIPGYNPSIEDPLPASGTVGLKGESYIVFFDPGIGGAKYNNYLIYLPAAVVNYGDKLSNDSKATIKSS